MIYNNITGLNDTYKFVRQYASPRLFYGVGLGKDDRGLCYHNIPLSGIDESIRPMTILNSNFNNTSNINNTKTNNTTNSTNNTTTYTAEFQEPTSSSILPFYKFSSSEGIYNNPLFENALTYEDSISWGCVDKLNATGLRSYCTNQLWKQKMIFNIVNNLTHLAQFGNANRHLPLDWIQVNPFSLDSYQSIWDETYHKCTIPANLNIDILYATYGAVNNTQVGFYKILFRMDYMFWWSKNFYDTTYKDNFFSYVNVNYYKVPQETVWWYAKAPGFIYLPKNIMYPFRIGTTTYGMKSSGFSINLGKSFYAYLIVFLIFIIN